MDLELLRTFLELNRTRHFGRCGEALHVTQAAISARLKLLEQILGVRLFERSRRAMRLTPEGARLVRHAEKLIASWRVARQEVSLSDASEQLTIGGSLRLWDVLLQRWLHDLRRALPTMAIIAESQTPDILTRRLIDGTLDVAIMLEPAQIDTMIVREIASVRLIFVSSSPDARLETALQKNYVYVDWGLSFALEHRRAFPDAPEAMTRLSHPKMAIEYLSSIGGSAYLPARMVEKDVEFGLLHEVVGAPHFDRRAYATFPVRSARLELIEHSLGLVRQ